MLNNIFEIDYGNSKKLKIKAKRNGRISYSCSSNKEKIKSSSSISVPLLQEYQEGKKKPFTKLNYSFQARNSSGVTSTLYYHLNSNLEIEWNFNDYLQKSKLICHNSFLVNRFDAQFSTTLSQKKLVLHQTLSKKIENDRLKFSGNLEYDFTSKQLSLKSFHTDFTYKNENTLVLFQNQLLKNSELTILRQYKNTIYGMMFSLDNKLKFQSLLGLQYNYNTLQLNGQYEFQKNVFSLSAIKKVQKFLELKMSIKLPCDYKDIPVGLSVKLNL